MAKKKTTKKAKDEAAEQTTESPDEEKPEEAPDADQPEEEREAWRPPTRVNTANEGKEITVEDFAYVDLVGKTKKGTVFQVTNEDRAKELGLYDEKKQFGPELVKVGSPDFLMKGVMDALAEGCKVGDVLTVELAPEDGFGKRQASKIRAMGARQFKKIFNKVPQRGLQVQDPKSREEGVVTRVGSGRVRVDFNHPLAGQAVEYQVTVLDKVEAEEDLLNAFLTRRGAGIDPTQFEITKDDEGNMEIVLPQMMLFQQNLVMWKFGVSMDLQRYLDVGDVRFVEVFKKRAVPGAPAAEAAADVDNQEAESDDADAADAETDADEE